MNLTKTKPNIFHIVRLRCPYCGQTPLQRKGSWFDFDQGCQPCDYPYEREEGYFAGSTWMINYSVISLFGILVAAACAFFTSMNGLMIASATSVSIVIFGILFFPYGNALWIYFDHFLHPLKAEERWDRK